jgi:autotransporter-associated beta strand protein
LSACALAIGAALVAVPTADGDQIKADNTAPLNTGSAWVGGAAPTASELAVFDNTPSAAHTTYSLGDDLQVWLGVKVLNPVAPITLSTGSTLTLGSAGLDLASATQSFTIGANLQLAASQSWTVAASSGLAVSGAVSGPGVTLTVGGAGNTTVTGPINTLTKLTKTGTGTLTLSGANGFTAATVNNGTLALAFTAQSPAANILPTSAAVTLAGGTLSVAGGPQTLDRLFLTAGGNTLTVAANTTLTLTNNFSKAADAPAVLRITNAGTIATGMATLGLLNDGASAYATFGYDHWAAISANRIVAASYSDFGSGTFNNSSANVNVTGNFATGGGTITSFRFAAPTAYTVSVSGTETTQGILVASTAAGAAFAGGILRPQGSSGTVNFPLFQNSTAGDLSISSVLANPSSATANLVKSGPGRALLSGANTYTGGTYVYEGTLAVTANAGLGLQTSAKDVTLDGGTLEAAGTFGLYNGSPGVNNRNVVLGQKGGTLAAIAGNTLTVAGTISGNNPLAIAGPGVVQLTGTNAAAATTINPGGTFRIGNGGTGGTLGANPVTNNGTLAFNRSNAVSVSAPISGTGALTHLGASSLTFTSPVSLTGLTTLGANSLIFSGTGLTAHSLGRVSGPGLLQVTGLARLTSDGLAVDTLQVDGLLTVRQNGGAAGASLVNALSLTGTLDLTDNVLALQSTSLTKASAVASLQTFISSGSAGGTWAGPGLTSSLLPANASATLALADNADLHLSSYRGLTGLSDNALLVTLAKYGDATLDGTVNAADLAILDAHWHQSTAALWSAGDFTGDGHVDAFDLTALLSNWQPSAGDAATALAAFPQLNEAVVPEPTSLSLLALGAIPLLLRRPKRT